MTELIKQRLVGMLIVVIAGIVFIPDLLDGQKQTSKSDFKKIPEQPDFDGRPMIKDFPSQQVDRMIAQVPNSDDVASDNEDESTSDHDGYEEVNNLAGETAGLSSQKGKLSVKNNPNTTTLPKNSETDSAPSSDLPSGSTEAVTVSQSSVNSDQKKPGEHQAATDKPQSNQTAQVEAKAKNQSTNTSRFTKPLYILQLGSFKHKENVTTLREKLKSAGYETYIKPVKTKSAVLSKVYIGPESDRQKLKEAQIKARELTGLEGKITRFQPTN